MSAMLGQQFDNLIVVSTSHVIRKNGGIAQDHTSIGMADEFIHVGILHLA
jgi:hypothetical protein